MKEFVKTLNKQSVRFKENHEKIPYMSAEKVKKGVFVGLQLENSPKTRNFYVP